MRYAREMLLVLIPLALMSFAGSTQVFTKMNYVYNTVKWTDNHIHFSQIDSIPVIDTSSTRISNVNLRAAVKIIESLRIDSILAARDIFLLRQRITARNNTITQLNKKIETFRLLAANYEKSNKNLQEQVNLSGLVLQSTQHQVRKERTKTVLIAIAGIVVSGFTLYLTTR